MRGDFIRHPIWGIGVVVKAADEAGQPPGQQDVWFGEFYGQAKCPRIRAVNVDDCEWSAIRWHVVENPDPN